MCDHVLTHVKAATPTSRGSHLPFFALALFSLSTGPNSPVLAQTTAGDLIAHRAVYDLNLVEAQSDSGIEFANGLFIFEVTGSACAGWNMASDMILSIQGRTGGTISTQTSYRAFEDGDGEVFTFQTNTETNDEEPEMVTGAAERQPEGDVTIRRFADAETTTAAIAETLFPNQLTDAVLQAAFNDETLVFTSVFDGSHDSGLAQPVTAIIGSPAMPTVVSPIGERAHREDTDTDPLMESQNPAVWESFPTPTRAWPVTLSYFDPVESDAGPSFVVKYTLDTNGVSDDLILDYGSFTLSGALVDFIPYHSAGCD